MTSPTKKTGFIRILIYTFLFTLCIESLQLVTRVGVFDVDDLLMNTLGGLAGWVCYCLALKVFRIVRKRCRKNSRREKE